MLEELVARVFATRNAAHLQHWRSKSLSEHQALGQFYDGVIAALDTLVEAHQGQNGLLGHVPAEKPASGRKILAILKDDLGWLQAMGREISGGKSALQNLLDGVAEVYLKTIYLLENLS